MSEFLKQKKRMRKTIVTKKAVRYLTYMRQSDENVTNLRVKFSDNLPPTKAKRKDGYTFLHGRNENVIHTCKFKHRLNETTSSIWFPNVPNSTKEGNDLISKGGVNTLLCLLGPILCGALILVHILSLHIILRIIKSYLSLRSPL